MTDLTTQTPTEIDTQLAEIMGRLWEAQNRRDSAQRNRDMIAKRMGFNPPAWDVASLERVQAQVDAAIALVEATSEEAIPFEAEFARRGGWTRAWKVTNTGGHIHSSMACQTCFITTQFAWLPEVSGMDEAEIVELAAAAACTVCFPTAPVDRPTQLFTAAERATAAEREAKAVAKIEREAKRIARAITADGSELVLDMGWSWPERIKTLVAARSKLTDAFDTWRDQPEDITALDWPVLIAAIAAKEGKTEAQVIEEAKVRAAKRK